MHAEKDLKGFLIASALAMLTGYHTSNDVLKQVSHRGAIQKRMADSDTVGSIDSYGMEEMLHTMTT